MGASIFNAMELDAIGEIMNISMGASATAVSTMLGAKVNITTPTVNVQTSDSFEFRELEPAVGVEISYVEGLKGTNVMMFARNDVRIIVGMLMGAEIPEDQFELDEINMSAICEVMNQMMGSSATALSEFLGYTINISTPVSFPVENEAWFKERYFPKDQQMVVVHFLLEIEGKLKNEFLNIMSVDLAKHLIEPFQSSILENGEKEETAAQNQAKTEVDAPTRMKEPQPHVPEAASSDAQPHTPTPAEESKLHTVVPVQEEPKPRAPEAESPEPQYTPEPNRADSTNQAEPSSTRMQGAPIPSAAPYAVPVYQPSADPALLQLIQQMQQSQVQMMELMKEMKDKDRTEQKRNIIRPAVPEPLSPPNDEGEEESINQEMLMKVPLELSVEVGRTRKLVKEILELTQGSLVVLDKMAGEQADLYVNGQCIAKGDIVVVEDNFGIRITEIIARNLNPEIL